jgi:transposase
MSIEELKSGQSTHGYGKTKELVMQAHAQGLSMPETAKACGLSYASVYSVKKRMGLDFKPDKGRRKHGSVKELVLKEHEKGLTIAQIYKQHNLSRYSVKAVHEYCNLKPNETPQKLR